MSGSGTSGAGEDSGGISGEPLWLPPNCGEPGTTARRGSHVLQANYWGQRGLVSDCLLLFAVERPDRLGLGKGPQPSTVSLFAER
jgi:hypothetical protein